MSAGIQHLAKDNKARPSRVDSMDADRMNSIVERLSGVNPSKLVAEAAGHKVDPSPVTAPMTEAARGFDPSQHYVNRSSESGAELRQMQERMHMLEQRLAMYEQGEGDPAFSANYGPSNRGPESRIWRRDMDPKKAKKKDPVDGEPDGKQAQPGGQTMAGEHMNILGMSMNEWRDLAGIQNPTVDLTTGQVPAHVLAESEEYTEGYFAEDELIEAWISFLDGHGWDAEEFRSFAEAAEELGDEDALIAIQDLEDEFQEALDYCAESGTDFDAAMQAYLRSGGKITKGKTRKAKGYTSLSRGTASHKGKPSFDKRGHKLPSSAKAANEDVELTQEEVDSIWELWLEGRGLSVEMFNYLIDEAIASEDHDEMDALLAVEEMFYQFLEAEVLRGKSPFGVKAFMQQHAGKDITDLLKKKNGPSQTAVVTQKKAASNEDIMMALAARLAEAEKVSPDDPIHGQVAGMKSLVPKKLKASLRQQGAKSAEKPSEDPRKWAKGWQLASFEYDEEGGLSFECDSDEKGEPKIPWARIMKAYKMKGKKSQEERGFGGMSREGY